jgi:hypothetical protein
MDIVLIRVIVAAATLHNLAIHTNEAMPDEWLEDLEEEVDDVEPIPGNMNNLGRHFRQLLLINEYAAAL